MRPIKIVKMVDPLTQLNFEDFCEELTLCGATKIELYINPSVISKIANSWDPESIRYERVNDRYSRPIYKLGCGFEIDLCMADMPSDRIGVKTSF